jgi:2-oxoisovalerate dehydrogenase E1 component
MPETPPDWLAIARLALLSRAVDRLQIEELAPQGKVKYQFSASGHEVTQALLAHALNHPHDAATVYYRCRPFVMGCGMSVTEALAADMAKGELTQGRDTGVIFNLPPRGGAAVLPSSGNVGAQYTPAAGWAQAIRYYQRVLQDPAWQGAISAALGGDGSVAANGFWAALNIVTTQALPMLFYIEDNGYGISVPAVFQTPGGNIAANLEGYGGLLVLDADGSQPLAAWNTIQQAVTHIRNDGGPVLLRMRVPRLTGHTFVDDQSYKSAALRQEELERDPLVHLREFLLAQGTTLSAWQDLQAEAERKLAQALHEVEALPEPDPTQTLRHVFFEGIEPRQGGLRPLGALPGLGTTTPTPSGPRINFVDAVRRTLELEMRLNPRLAVFGEDVGRKGGVHGATLDMQAHFGEERVFDTSLSEDGIMGRAAGMAQAGLLPVPEIQFRKYADPAHEQITDLGTLRWRSANQFAAPMVVRIPVGFGKKTGDPWHSVSAEAIYAHTLGWRIAFPSNAQDAVGLLRTALRGDDPAFFLEHRALLDSPEGRRPYPGDDYCLPFGLAETSLIGQELTVITWGAMVVRCQEAAAAFPGRITVLDLRTIIPWDQEAVLESVRRTGKALVVHEDTLTAGFGAEIVAVIAAQAFQHLDAPVERLATPDVLIPYNHAMMDTILPSSTTIRLAMQRLLDF